MRYNFSSFGHRCILGELYGRQEVWMWWWKNKNKPYPLCRDMPPFIALSLFVPSSVGVYQKLPWVKNEEYWHNMTRDLFHFEHEYWFMYVSGPGSCHCQWPQDGWVWNMHWPIVGDSRSQELGGILQIQSLLDSIACLSEGTCWELGSSNSKFANVALLMLFNRQEC